MCRAECILEAVGLYENRGCICTAASVHRSRGSYALSSAVSTSRHKEKEEGFPKGGTWVHLFGSVPEARPAQNQRLGKTNEIQTDYPDNIQHYLPPRREGIGTHDRASVNERLREYGSSVTLAKHYTISL